MNARLKQRGAYNRFSHEEIAKYTELTLDEIEELARKIAASS